MPKVKVVYLPAGEGGAKVGLDDYLAAGHSVDDLIALATEQLRDAPSEESEIPTVRYEETRHGLVWLKETKHGTIPTLLTNFTAHIITDVAEDDGTEVRHLFEIETRLGEETKRFEVSAAQFSTMNWVTAQLGARAIIYPGFTLQDHARAAIQLLSENITERQIYAHTGWRPVDGVWIYLYAGGAIGPNGPVPGVEVRLPDALARFALPSPPTGENLVRAIRANLKLLRVAPERVTLPLLATIARSPLMAADFGVHFSGLTGAGKTALAALAQQHYGPEMDAEHLPVSWSSTGNALEALAFQAKDALLVVDDFAPTGSQADIQRMHREADRVLRAQGNISGRQRLRPDGTLRPAKPPRGLIISTGEDVPRGQSLRARVLVLELKMDDLDWDLMTECQADAQKGLYAQSLSGYVRFLAQRYARIRSEFQSKIEQWRQQATGSATHRRIPTIIANLMAGLEYWFQYAEESGAITSDEAADLARRAWTALAEAAKAQQQLQEASDPTRRFQELLAAAIASGRAHIATPRGDAPTVTPEAWGWRAVTVGTGDSERIEWRPHGDRVGWVERDDLYLEPEASYAVAQRLAHDGGDSITVGSKTLHKRLHERGLLVLTEKGRHKLTVRRTLEGQRRAVLHLRAGLLSG